jgi:predicted secreted hydrolase
MHGARFRLAALATAAVLGASGLTHGAAGRAAAPTPPPPDAAPAPSAPSPRDYPEVLPGGRLEFPADEGSHPDYRTEWWYVTGWLSTSDGRPLGFQVTFFRTRPTLDTANPSAFAARQVVIAHAAVSDPAHGRLWHAQRIARAGFGLADAAIGRTDVHVRDWFLRAAGTAFMTRVSADDFGYALRLERVQPPLANGRDGYSQKGPAPESASWYYSVPHLRVTGTLTRSGRTETVTGSAWLDHEWSSAYLDADSAGWDWTGLNLDDGGALMAFRIRDRDGGTRWAAGTLRAADGGTTAFGPSDVEFVPGRAWRSPRTGIEYPVEWRLRAGTLELGLVPLLDDQESDSRLTTGAVYWEGAVTATRDGRRVGRGYLELTGYGEPLRLR